MDTNTPILSVFLPILYMDQLVEGEVVHLAACTSYSRPDGTRDTLDFGGCCSRHYVGARLKQERNAVCKTMNRDALQEDG